MVASDVEDGERTHKKEVFLAGALVSNAKIEPLRDSRCS